MPNDGAGDRSVAPDAPDSSDGGGDEDATEDRADDGATDEGDATDEVTHDATTDVVEEGEGGGPDATLPNDANGDGAPGDASAACASDPRVAVYAPNSTKTGQQGVLVFTLVKSDREPPAQGTNGFTVKIAQPDGGAFVGEVRANLTMPDFVIPDVPVAAEFETATGLYKIKDANLPFTGVWRFQFGAFTGAGTLVDAGVYFFCVGR
jgi:hypothetical protein